MRPRAALKGAYINYSKAHTLIIQTFHAVILKSSFDNKHYLKSFEMQVTHKNVVFLERSS